MLILLYVCIAAGCLFAGKILVHYFQLESYQFPGYFRTIRRNFWKAVLPGILMTLLFAVSFILFSVLFAEFSWYHYLLLALIMVSGGWITGKACAEKKAKKALVFTPRIKRLYAVALTVYFLILLLSGAFAASSASSGRSLSRPAAVFVLLFPLLLPLWTALAGFLAWPAEQAISEM